MKKLLAVLWLIFVLALILYTVYAMSKIALFVISLGAITLLVICITIHCIEIIIGEKLEDTTRRIKVDRYPTVTPSQRPHFSDEEEE